MKKLFIGAVLTFIITCIHASTYKTEQSGIIIGFRGLNNVFDQQAFEQFAADRNLEPVTFNADQITDAAEAIMQYNGYYEFYGYSLGAQSTMTLLKLIIELDLPKPGYITTIGAYHTANVDFRPYDVEFTNYFDSSGRGQRSPGIHIPRVGHHAIQEYINNCGC